MTRSFKSNILKTYAKLGFCLGTMGLMGGPGHDAQAQKPSGQNRNLFTTELGVEHYSIPALSASGIFLNGRASIIFNADQTNAKHKKTFGIHPIVAANYTYAAYQTPSYHYSYSNAVSRGFYASTGGYHTRTSGVNAEMGAVARLEHGPLTLNAIAAAQVPVWRTGTSGVGGNIRAEAKLNLLEIKNLSGDHNGTLYLKGFYTTGMQRTLLLKQNFSTPFEEVKLVPYNKFGITFGAKF
jgi:hypothetical protein